MKTDGFSYSHMLPKKPPADVAFGDAARLLTKTCKRCGVEFETRSRPKKRCDTCQDSAKAGHVPSTADSRVDVFVPSGRIKVRCPEERLGWRCGRCGRGIVARRMVGNKLECHQECPVCHVDIKVVDHGAVISSHVHRSGVETYPVMAGL